MPSASSMIRFVIKYQLKRKYGVLRSIMTLPWFESQKSLGARYRILNY